MIGKVRLALGTPVRVSIVLVVFVAVGATALQHLWASDAPALGFYCVSTEPKPGWRHFSSTTFPNLGYIAGRPDLPVTRIKRVYVERMLQRSRAIHPDGSSEETKEYQPSLVIEFLPDDAKALHELTAAHLGQRVLLLVGEKPLFAPVIRTAIDGTLVSITLPPGVDPDKIRVQLEKLSEQKR